jgi:uncharacterized protein (DUF488 family)
MKLFTIGHSNHTMEKFIQLLDDNGIMLLVDVRTNPYSRYSPHFNKEYLERKLPLHMIEYTYAGKYLGGRPSDPSCYKNHKLPLEGADYLHEVNYPEVMKKKWFIQGIERLLELADLQTTAIMCSEENPAECHRHHLIAKYILSENPEIEIRHIRGDGSVFGAKTILASVDESPPAEQLSFF